MDFIIPNRTQISDRFPIASFNIGVPEERYFEVACATDPSLFHTEKQDLRNPHNFFTSRARGLLRAARAGTTYMLPSEQLKQFAGARRLYYALATYGGPRGDDARFTLHPNNLERAPSIALSSDFSGRTLDRARVGRSTSDEPRYGTSHARMTWGGDDALAAIPAKNYGGYDDGFGRSLWQDEAGECNDADDEGLDATSQGYAFSLEEEMTSGDPTDTSSDQNSFEDPNDGDAGLDQDDSSSAAPQDNNDGGGSSSYGGADRLAVAQWESNDEIGALAQSDDDLEPPDPPDPPDGDELDEGFEEHTEAYGARRRAEAHRFGGSTNACTCCPPAAQSRSSARAHAVDLGVKAKIESIVETAAEAESGDRHDVRKYSVTAATPHHRQSGQAFGGHRGGLSWGLIRFGQRSGSLGKVLKRFRDRSEAEYKRLFGAAGNELLLVTNAADPDERMRPVGGEALWDPSWIARFEEAGRSNACRAAQREVAVTEYLDPNLVIAARLGLTSDRALSMFYDRCIDMGNEQGTAWVVRHAGPIQSRSELNESLSALGYADIASFQASVEGLTVNGEWNPATHAALAESLRSLGPASPVQSPGVDQMLDRLVEASRGTRFHGRLQKLRRTTSGLQDVTFQLAN